MTASFGFFEQATSTQLTTSRNSIRFRVHMELFLSCVNSGDAVSLSCSHIIVITLTNRARQRKFQLAEVAASSVSLFTEVCGELESTAELLSRNDEVADRVLHKF